MAAAATDTPDKGSGLIAENADCLLNEPMIDRSTDPSLAALQTFVLVARYGSFRRAAAEKGVGASAFSHVIRGLEETLAVRLFHRTSRSVRLTDAGAALLARIGPALAEIAEALRGAREANEAPTGTLRLNIPRIVNLLVMEPVIGRFLSTYPGIRLEIASHDGLVDIVAEGFDAGIRRDRRLQPGMVATPIGPARRFAVVGAPCYFADRARPVTPADLREHRCIGRLFPDGSRYAWEFERDGEAIEVETTGPLIVDETALMIRAARDGSGLAFVFEELVAEPVATGALVRVLEDWCPPKPRFFLFYPGRRHVPAPLRAFIDMVSSQTRPRAGPER